MCFVRQTLGIVLTIGALGVALPATAQTFPDYTSTTVNDFADLLPDEDERALAQRLARLERDTGVELTVVTLPTQATFAPDMTLEAYATALFNHWGVGRAETNDGVMILVFRDDRAMRLELGAAYGRDWDRTAQDVVERNFLNAFATGNYTRGLVSGTEATIERIVMPFREGAAPPSGSGGPFDWLIMAGFGVVFLLAVARNRIGDAMARLRPCPNCGRYGLSQRREILTRATRTSTGAGERIKRCAYCDFEDRTSFHIPRRRSSSGGSFGGGRSGGGGASGRW
jgi:uncharacterized protein